MDRRKVNLSQNYIIAGSSQTVSYDRNQLDHLEWIFLINELIFIMCHEGAFMSFWIYPKSPNW